MPLSTEGISAPSAVRPRLLRAVGTGCRAAYDHLGFVLVGSLLWCTLAGLLGLGAAGLISLSIPGRTLGALIVAAVGGTAVATIGTGPLTAAIVHHARRILIRDDPSWWELFSAIPRLWRRGLTLALVQGVVTLVLIVDAGFFLAQEKALWRPVGMLFLYPLLFWWISGLLQWPLAMQRVEEPIWQVIKKSALLLIDNLAFVAMLAVILTLLLAICLVTRIGLVLAWAGVLAFIQTAALLELLPKYGPPPDTPATKEMTAYGG
jgi:hypothetical protein